MLKRNLVHLAKKNSRPGDNLCLFPLSLVETTHERKHKHRENWSILIHKMHKEKSLKGNSELTDEKS